MEARATRRCPCTCGFPSASRLRPIRALANADESLRYYASIVHAVGLRLEADGSLDVAAPFGLDDMFAMVIRPNRALDNAVSHTSKAQRAKAIWPEVIVEPWEAPA